MVFSGRLLKPWGSVPGGVYNPFATWQFWALVAGSSPSAAAIYWSDWVRGGEAAFMPPAGVVAAPLRRLFVLQFGVLVGGLVVYWPLKSSTTGLAVLVVVRGGGAGRASPCTTACARSASARRWPAARS